MSLILKVSFKMRKAYQEHTLLSLVLAKGSRGGSVSLPASSILQALPVGRIQP